MGPDAGRGAVVSLFVDPGMCPSTEHVKDQFRRPADDDPPRWTSSDHNLLCRSRPPQFDGVPAENQSGDPPQPHPEDLLDVIAQVTGLPLRLSAADVLVVHEEFDAVRRLAEHRPGKR